MVVDLHDVVFFISISNNDDILKTIIVFDFKSQGSRGSAIGTDVIQCLGSALKSRPDFSAMLKNIVKFVSIS